jgi:hypothetical protein
MSFPHRAFTGGAGVDETNAYVPSNAVVAVESARVVCASAAAKKLKIPPIANHHSHFEGTIGSQGELVMRAAAVQGGDANDVVASGRIDRDGTVRVRMTGNVCSFDVVWQKEHK